MLIGTGTHQWDTVHGDNAPTLITAREGREIPTLSLSLSLSLSHSLSHTHTHTQTLSDTHRKGDKT